MNHHLKEFIESGKWFQYSLMKQLANIGTDVDRACRWKKENKLEESKAAIFTAIDLLNFSIRDPKNKKQRRELLMARELLQDYFFGDNEHQTSDQYWYDYFIYFNQIYALERKAELDAKKKRA